jgi:DNA-3-methyladenine glycosylase II
MSAEALCRLDPVFDPVVAEIGPFRMVCRAEDPYAALVRAVAGQQLHARAADAIMGRLLALFPERDFPEPGLLAEADPVALRGCGFSGAKIAAIQGVAAAADAGIVPSRSDAERLSDEEIIARLTQLRGIGRWTVEMLLIFTLGRPDVLPIDDFGVREGWRRLTGAATQPRPRALAEYGARWAPVRTTAAWYLWRVADAAKGKK